ncbi:endonuclease/exonuclease/phosphatase family protein [Salipiger bermudensis]|nr:endonuclease/exonuclease/phosphatase family protein [Salipiger bermudensis]MCA0964473.1 endonuclease/exonuclease/phosphatase family protein [Salipiger bermudensis]
MLIVFLWLALPLQAEPLRLATWNADLSRKGPGLLLRDLRDGAGAGVVAEIAAVAPDVLLLTDIDFDHDLAALGALAARLEEAGLSYPHRFAQRPNTGLPTGLDLDGDGRLGGPRDAQGYGRFSGQGGMALLSRRPLRLEADFTALLWRDLSRSRMRDDDPAPGRQRLSSDAHWVIGIEGGPTLLAWNATPPVFDGPEDRNGRRNADEAALWRRYLDGAFGTPPDRPVLIGNANLDPERGEGLREEMRGLLGDPRLQDPLPGEATVAWDQTGPMRVSYILPAAELTVRDAGVRPAIEGQRHRLVWVTLDLP